MNSSPIHKLLWIMARLRDPESGCPWDLEQDFDTILPYTIEEAYEVADAIERGDMEAFQEELGDLLLQVVFQAQIAKDKGLFNFDDVAEGVVHKMVHRHPHVFGDVKAEQSDDVNTIWDQQKDKEKSQDSVLDGVTLGLPSLLRAQKLQKRAAKVGYEWPSREGAYEKCIEEWEELKDAVEKDDEENITEEIGDLIFCLVNYARMRGHNTEDIMRKTNKKFETRFRGMESELKTQNKAMKDASLEELLQSWQNQKKKEA